MRPSGDYPRSREGIPCTGIRTVERAFRAGPKMALGVRAKVFWRGV